MSIWFKSYSLEEINNRGKNTLVEHIDIVMTQITENELWATMPVNQKTVQPARILHGGASCVLAESLGSIAANLTIDTEKFIAVGQSISANHLRPGLEGTNVSAKTWPLHIGKKSQVWDIEIYNEEKKILCSSRLTMAIVPRK